MVQHSSCHGPTVAQVLLVPSLSTVRAVLLHVFGDAPRIAPELLLAGQHVHTEHHDAPANRHLVRRPGSCKHGQHNGLLESPALCWALWHASCCHSPTAIPCWCAIAITAADLVSMLQPSTHLQRLGLGLVDLLLESCPAIAGPALQGTTDPAGVSELQDTQQPVLDKLAPEEGGPHGIPPGGADGAEDASKPGAAAAGSDAELAEPSTAFVLGACGSRPTAAGDGGAARAASDVDIAAAAAADAAGFDLPAAKRQRLDDRGADAPADPTGYSDDPVAAAGDLGNVGSVTDSAAVIAAAAAASGGPLDQALAEANAGDRPAAQQAAAAGDVGDDDDAVLLAGLAALSPQVRRPAQLAAAALTAAAGPKSPREKRQTGLDGDLSENSDGALAGLISDDSGDKHGGDSNSAQDADASDPEQQADSDRGRTVQQQDDSNRQQQEQQQQDEALQDGDYPEADEEAIKAEVVGAHGTAQIAASTHLRQVCTLFYVCEG